MRNYRVFLLAAAFYFVGCSKAPEPSGAAAPPPAVIKARSNPTKTTILMNDPSVNDYIVKDVSEALEGNTWRWSYDRPELRFNVKDTANQKLEVHFVVADATFKTTGPVTAQFFVNDKVVGSMKITKPGDYVFSKPIPAALFKPDSFDTVAVEARPFWTSKTDGRHLSVILIQAGFVAASHT
jgi:hypothetical protein